MNNFKHPSELNPLRLYQQAKRIAQKTSRAKNPDWYQDPNKVQRQWHLWLDGEEVLSSLFDQKAQRWVEGPTLSWLGREDEESSVTVEGGFAIRQFESKDREELHGGLAEALRSRELGGKANSLGVILHVADEFAVLDPAREYSGNRDFEEVQALLQVDPKEVLGDSTIDPLLDTWQLMPCWGVKELKVNVAVQLGRQREEFFSIIRDYAEDNNVAVIVSGVSAPLEALRLAPIYLDWSQSEERGDIIVMMYRNFSALMVLNEVGELVLLRSLSHLTGKEYPSNLGDTLLNTSTSAGLSNPVVSILPMCGGTGKEQLTAELTTFFARKNPMDIGFTDLDQLDALQDIPNHRMEMLLGDEAKLGSLLENNPLMETATFTGLAEGWATQDFYSVIDVEAEKFPTWQELQLRRYFGIAKVGLLGLVIAMGTWGGLKVVKTLGTDEWQAKAIEPEAAASGGKRKEKAELDYWQSIMQTRSEGWLVMQLLLDLFPEGGGIVITDFEYKILAGQTSGKSSGSKAKGLGYSRQWKFSGFSTPEGRSTLAKLGSTGFMTNRFEEFAGKYQSTEFELEAQGRSVAASLEEDVKAYAGSGSISREEAALYSTSFMLLVTQRVFETDELAVPIKVKLGVPIKVGK